MNQQQKDVHIKNYLHDDKWLQQWNPNDFVLNDNGSELLWLGYYALPRKISLTNIFRATCFRRIYFHKIFLNKNALLRIADALNRNSTLQELLLDNCNINSLTLRHFALRLKENVHIKSLSLKLNYIGGDRPFCNFKELFSAFPELVYLNLELNCIYEQSAKDFSSHIDILSNLQVLRCDFNRDELEMPKSVINHQRQQILRQFYRHSNILRTLASLQYIKILEFGMSNMSFELAKDFFIALQTHPHICAIDLHKIDDEHFSRLVCTMRCMKKLKKFTLWGGTGPQVTKVLCENWLLSDNCKLQELHFAANVCDPHKIFSAMRSNKSITRLVVFRIDSYYTKRSLVRFESLSKELIECRKTASNKPLPNLNIELKPFLQWRGREHRHPVVQCSIFFECVFNMHSIFDNNAYIYLWLAEFLCDQHDTASMLTQFEKIKLIEQALYSIARIKALREKQ